MFFRSPVIALADHGTRVAQVTSYPVWPLHPPPSRFDNLRIYVARIAELYDVSYNVFCLNALEIPLTDSAALSMDNPSDEVLERLSAGVGVPVADLRALLPRAKWERLYAEIKAFMETEEGKQALEAMCAGPYRWTRP